jgi:hypothetical protein
VHGHVIHSGFLVFRCEFNARFPFLLFLPRVSSLLKEVIICLCISFSKMEDRSWMYNGLGGDPLLYLNLVIQFVYRCHQDACLPYEEKRSMAFL